MADEKPQEPTETTVPSEAVGPDPTTSTQADETQPKSAEQAATAAAVDEVWAAEEPLEPPPAPRPDVDALIAERDQYREMAQRARADFENFQRRVKRDNDLERRYAAMPFLTDLLPVLDNLDRAIESSKTATDVQGILIGIQMVRRQINDTLGKHGVVEIAPNGELFDPHLHQAISQEATADVPPMTVLQTVQSGYKFHDRVVRAAHVIVAKQPVTQDDSPTT